MSRTVVILKDAAPGRTHGHDCFIVNRRWPGLPWITLRASDVPRDTPKCRFCGGGDR